jgi:hypothetical protein
MLSRQIARRAAAVAFLLFLFVTCMNGDVIIVQDFTYYGKIIQITGDEVTFNELCSSEYRKTLKWEEIRHLLFNSDCKPPAKRPQIAGIGSGNCATAQRKIVYVVFFRDDQRAYGTGLSTDDKGNITINLIDEHKSLRGPLDKISQISRRKFCPDAIPKSRWPKEFTQ